MSLKMASRGLGLSKTTVLVSGRKKIVRGDKTIIVTVSKPTMPPERWIDLLEKFSKG